mmetsp:Transcript_26558/g.74226  ORF Transcript_26558/g.74226 Transcript_26558/m.74226 type:complete len:235 (-) Transcript_26558:159-863(-)
MGSRAQSGRVVAQVVVDERGDEVVRVVIALLEAQLDLHRRAFRRRDQALRLQLALQELVARAHVHQHLQRRPGVVLHQLARVVGPPRVPVAPEVAREALLPPRHLRGVHNRREGRDGAVRPRVAQSQHQRAVASHGVPGDAAVGGVQAVGQVPAQHAGQLLRDELVHSPVLGPGLHGGVEVEACADPKVVSVALARHVQPPRRGVRGHQGHPELRRRTLGAGLENEVGVVARQA